MWELPKEGAVKGAVDIVAGCLACAVGVSQVSLFVSCRNLSFSVGIQVGGSLLAKLGDRSWRNPDYEGLARGRLREVARRNRGVVVSIES